MKVQIIKCNGKEFWYANKIGQIFDVDIFDFMHYRVIGDSTLLILKTDTIPVEKQQFNNLDLKMQLIHYLSKKTVTVKSYDFTNEVMELPPEDTNGWKRFELTGETRITLIIQKTKKKKHG